MAEVKSPEEATLPIKRTSELHAPESLSSEPKKPKLDINNTTTTEETTPPLNDAEPKQLQQDDKPDKFEEQEEQKEEGEINGKEVIDRKGKGILIDEDDEDDDDDDDSDSDSDSSDSGIGDGLSDDSDFADDPLAEVDLNNIVSSRTRRKIIHPGVYLSSDIPPEDSDESDDPDA